MPAVLPTPRASATTPNGVWAELVAAVDREELADALGHALSALRELLHSSRERFVRDAAALIFRLEMCRIRHGYAPSYDVGDEDDAPEIDELSDECDEDFDADELDEVAEDMFEDDESGPLAPRADAPQPHEPKPAPDAPQPLAERAEYTPERRRRTARLAQSAAALPQSADFRLKTHPRPAARPTTIGPVVPRRVPALGFGIAASRRTYPMALKRITTRALATLTLWAGFGLTAFAQLPAMTVEKALEVKPKQAGVNVSTPAPNEVGRCRVDPIPGGAGKPNLGYVVRDGGGRPVRQFVSYDNKTFNIVAFYIDGQEAYREVILPDSKEPKQYRWLGANGGKWGLDKDHDGRIDEWAVISPEEVSQELLQAIVTRDAKRLEALLMTKENLDALQLPAAEATRIREKAAGAAKKLLATAEALKLSPNAKWGHLELGAPHTTAADAFGGPHDLVTHRNGIIQVQDGDKMHFVQTGEMVLAGPSRQSWKLVEGPSDGFGTGPNATPNPGTGPEVLPVIKDLVGQLDNLDKEFGAKPPTAPELVAHYGKRAVILEQIVQKVPAEKQTEWAKMLVDSLTAAADGEKNDGKSVSRLRQLKDAFAKGGVQNPLAAYAAFRTLQAENSIALAGADAKSINAVQEKWRAGLDEFVKAFPNAEDAPEAVLRLAMSYEFVRKEGEAKEAEAKAKQWYDHLTKTYPQHPHAAKAAGAIKRLDSEGKPLELSGTSVTTGQPFAANHLAGKVVVVYYWASWSTTLADDAKKLRDLKTAYGPKGLEIVTVCLDDDAKVAQQAANGLNLPATHLHAAGGLDRSPLAAGYGIHVAPHVFVVGKDGKVVNRNAQVLNLDDDLKKLTDK
jgi:thiol-disulfide isomerase/thioredoxin